MKILISLLAMISLINVSAASSAIQITNFSKLNIKEITLEDGTVLTANDIIKAISDENGASLEISKINLRLKVINADERMMPGGGGGTGSGD
jgi:hypothetical protein